MGFKLLEVGLTVTEGTSSEFDGPGFEKELKRGHLSVEWYHYHICNPISVVVPDQYKL
jgi:hypothetical protein